MKKKVFTEVEIIVISYLTDILFVSRIGSKNDLEGVYVGNDWIDF